MEIFGRCLPRESGKICTLFLQFRRDNWLFNRVLQDYDDIVGHCRHHWNRLIDQPWRIMSIGLRDWAHGF